MRCRLEYIQSVCNADTAMKVCENYIIEGDHCVDTLTECRNMTFENDKGPLTRTFQEYDEKYKMLVLHYDYFDFVYNRSGVYGFRSWVFISICLLISQIWDLF